MAGVPTYQDADLLLRVYDLRREARLRKARDFVLGKASYRDYADFKKKYPMESEGRRHMGMVFTYWDMVCTLVDRGLLNEDLFNSCHTEHVFLWLKYAAAVRSTREEYRFPEMLSNLEKVAMRHPAAARMGEWMSQQEQAAAAKPKRRARR